MYYLYFIIHKALFDLKQLCIIVLNSIVLAIERNALIFDHPPLSLNKFYKTLIENMLTIKNNNQQKKKKKKISLHLHYTFSTLFMYLML